MDCIPYINDLKIEIQILKDIRASGKCDMNNVTKQIEEKERLITQCQNNLSKLSNNQICYRIYLYILQGMPASKAIDKIAEENYINDVKPTSPSNLWKYYKKMQKILKQE